MRDASLTSPIRSFAVWTSQWMRQLRGTDGMGERESAATVVRHRGYTPMRDGGVVGFSTCVVALTGALNELPGARDAFVDLACVEDALLLFSSEGVQLLPHAVVNRAAAQLSVLITAAKVSRIHRQALEALLSGIQGGWEPKRSDCAQMDFFGRRRGSLGAGCAAAQPSGQSLNDPAWMDTVPEEPPGWADTLPGPVHG